jgi:hypothetical protein
MLMELAVWKSKINQKHGQIKYSYPTDMKSQFHIDSVSMVTIIVPMLYPHLVLVMINVMMWFAVNTMMAHHW